MSAQNSPAPLDVATEAKRNRDLAGEIGALTAADRDLASRPWFPLRAGDVVLAWLPPQGDLPGYGVTYLATDQERDLAGNAMLSKVAASVGLMESTKGGRPPLPEYLLSHTGQAWQLECPDDDTGADLAPWETADPAIPAGDLDAAKAWAVKEIATIEEDDNPVVGWKPWPDDDSEGLAAVLAVDEVPYVPLLDSFYELWFEVGAAGLTVIRAGQVVHGAPARAGDR